MLSSVVQAFLLRHGFVTSDCRELKRPRREDSLSPSPSPQPSPSKTRRRRPPLQDEPQYADRFASGSIAINELDATTDHALPYAYHVCFTRHSRRMDITRLSFYRMILPSTVVTSWYGETLAPANILMSTKELVTHTQESHLPEIIKVTKARGRYLAGHAVLFPAMSRM